MCMKYVKKYPFYIRKCISFEISTPILGKLAILIPFSSYHKQLAYGQKNTPFNLISCTSMVYCQWLMWPPRALDILHRILHSAACILGNPYVYTLYIQ